MKPSLPRAGTPWQSLGGVEARMHQSWGSVAGSDSSSPGCTAEELPFSQGNVSKAFSEIKSEDQPHNQHI